MQSPLHTVREILDSMINVGFPPDAAGAVHYCVDARLRPRSMHRVELAPRSSVEATSFQLETAEYPVENVTVELGIPT